MKHSARAAYAWEPKSTALDATATPMHANLLISSEGERSRPWAAYSRDCVWLVGVLGFLITVWIWIRPAAYSPGWDALLY